MNFYHNCSREYWRVSDRYIFRPGCKGLVWRCRDSHSDRKASGGSQPYNKRHGATCFLLNSVESTINNYYSLALNCNQYYYRLADALLIVLLLLFTISLIQTVCNIISSLVTLASQGCLWWRQCCLLMCLIPADLGCMILSELCVRGFDSSV